MNMEEKVTIEKTGWWKSFLKSEFFYHYKHNIPAIIGSILVVVAILVAVFGRFLAPQNPYDLTAISLADSYLPPVWLDGGKAGFFLGSIFSQLDPGVFYHNTIAIYIISIIDQAVCLHHSIVIHIIPCILGAYPGIPNEASVVVIVVIPFSILLRPVRKRGRRHSCG